MSTAEIVDDIYETKSYLPGAIPLCLDGNGNLCVARTANSQVAGYYVAACGDLEWASAKLIADTFTDFLQDTVTPEARLRS
jgi:hypothetical protein